jgi:prepilin-type N-terminal cleavage/methylation domain-containing protein
MMSRLLKQAFTLIELLVVIAIIGILSGLIVVSMGGVTQKANIAKAQVFSNSLRNSLMTSVVGEWKFDELTTAINGTVIQDSWGNVNPGTLNTGADPAVNKLSTDCVSGKCLTFDGIDDYVNCGTNSSLNFGNGTTDSPFTLSGWFKLSDMTTRGLMGKYAGGYQYLLWISGGDMLSFNLYDSSTSGFIGRYYYPSITSYENQWIYLVATYDGSAISSGIKIYLNGARGDNTNSISGTYTAMEVTGTNFRIGTYGGGTYLSGLADDVRIYNSAIPTSQIQEQYYAGLNGLLTNGVITEKEYLSRIDSIADIK